jgi:hypothetical protein
MKTDGLRKKRWLWNPANWTVKVRLCYDSRRDRKILATVVSICVVTWLIKIDSVIVYTDDWTIHIKSIQMFQSPENFHPGSRVSVTCLDMCSHSHITDVGIHGHESISCIHRLESRAAHEKLDRPSRRRRDVSKVASTLCHGNYSQSSSFGLKNRNEK